VRCIGTRATPAELFLEAYHFKCRSRTTNICENIASNRLYRAKESGKKQWRRKI
jgi:hypothetical protein